MSEMVVREALRERILAAMKGARETVDEFWVPRSNERADLAVIGTSMDGFEIKTERDTLTRLPRQVKAYGHLFDRCSVVVAERHLNMAKDIVPAWWGISVVQVNGEAHFTDIRTAGRNPDIDREILVRLLWKDEVQNALVQLGATPEGKTSRSALWEELLKLTNLNQLRATVRRALLDRDPSRARIATKRFRLATATQVAE